MRISDTELKKVMAMGGVSLIQTEHGFEPSPREGDEDLIAQLIQEVKAMPDREAMIAELKEKIANGEYNPSGDEIAETMIRRAIADRLA